MIREFDKNWEEDHLIKIVATDQVVTDRRNAAHDSLARMPRGYATFRRLPTLRRKWQKVTRR
jgi:hypothetical protein